MFVLTKINLQPLNYDEPLHAKYAQPQQKEAWSAVDELLHQKIGGSSYAQSGWDHEDARKKFAEGYVCLTCYRTVEKCSSLESLLQTLAHRQHWSMYNHHPWRLGTCSLCLIYL